MYKERKQDGVFFAGIKTTKDWLQHLAFMEPLVFRSGCPIFMPLENFQMIELKLDSNVIFYEKEDDSKYNLVDTFAVNGGPPIVLRLGTWYENIGVKLEMRMNRWERRTDLMGAVFINSLWTNGDGAAFKYDDNGTIVGSWGIFQEMLFYMTDRLNVTMITKDAHKEDINGTVLGCNLMLEINLTDVCSGGWPMVGLPGESIPIHRIAHTLIAGVPTGNAPDAWVYLEVFGLPQWIIFFSLLLVTSLAMKLTIALSKDIIDDNSGIVGLPTIYQFAIQGGSHPVTKHVAPRMISFTVGMVTLLMFIYYGNEITSKMTAGSPRHPVKTFEDVLFYDYKVIVIGMYQLYLLMSSPPASGKHMYYKAYFENFVQNDFNDSFLDPGNELLRPWSRENLEWAATEVRRDPKVLLYCADTDVNLDDTMVALKMDDAFYTMVDFIMQKNSEYLEMFNYYLLKEIEHGIVNRLWHPDPIAKIGINEPQPLGINKVMFPFCLLGASIVLSMTIAAIEMINAVISAKNKAAISSKIKYHM